MNIHLSLFGVICVISYVLFFGCYFGAMKSSERNRDIWALFFGAGMGGIIVSVICFCFGYK